MATVPEILRRADLVTPVRSPDAYRQSCPATYHELSRGMQEWLPRSGRDLPVDW
jgi:hypothetical protein